ncbi:GNAT family N-acetyltransferase [Paenibacillus sp. R14(2021)]|uniref:GNAT family N-acetyltransferase n=1 Tax=Paenibacillus sp. R14(2021) TaxID=2859228 RepID=UPI001C612EF3|nr:GNAT family N-acetyltransferase [Paenibacillus sp. R14(2021)]
MRIRRASIHDIEGIASVHAESWKSTYKGIIADAYLSSLTVEGRKQNWTRIFDHLDSDQTVLILEHRDGRVAGFIHGGKSRESDMTYSAEVYAFYLLREFQGQGYGKLLFRTFIDAMKAMNHRSFMLWVLKDNPALQFYQKVGGETMSSKKILIGEERLIEVALGWHEK